MRVLLRHGTVSRPFQPSSTFEFEYEYALSLPTWAIHDDMYPVDASRVPSRQSSKYDVTDRQH